MECTHKLTAPKISSRQNPEFLKDNKYPSLSKPDQSYNNIRFSETFGDFGFAMKVKADTLRDLGCNLSPQNAFYIMLGVETIGPRMMKHVSNAEYIASFLLGKVENKYFESEGNFENMVFAYKIAKNLKINEKIIIKALKEFKGLPHRQEYIFSKKKHFVH